MTVDRLPRAFARVLGATVGRTASHLRRARGVLGGLGTVAAERAGHRGWACACAVGDAPVVAWFVVAPRANQAEVEPAPLAGLLALLAGIIALLALLVGS